MSHIRIDKQKALKKWSPVLENMGVAGEDRLDWMSEYAEFHSINENAYVNASLAGMGSVVSPNPGLFAGSTINISTTSPNSNGNVGSGDLGQNLLPVAMKIAAQTIGLDLVAVKPTPGPKLDLLYIDFQYDDVDMTEGNPQVFKYSIGTATGTTDAAIKAAIQNAYLSNSAIVERVGGLDTFDAPNNANYRIVLSLNLTGQAGLTASSVSATASATAISTSTLNNLNKQGIVEFLGFSRIDGLPIFRAFRQANAFGNSNISGNSPYAAASAWDQTQNTFAPTTSMLAQITNIAGLGTISSPTNAAITLISALEDHLPGFSTNFSANSQSGRYPMSRSEDDNSYSGVIGPKVSTKSIAVGTIEVSSALRRTEIEDIKANTGMDIVQKMESILVNELSQTISKQIVSKIFEMGDLNRNSAPGVGSTTYNSISGATIFDLDTAYAIGSTSTLGGETTHAVQRKLITKMVHASNYIATEGRVGPAQFAVTNGGLAAAMMDIAGYTINPTKSKINGTGQLYPVGQIGDIQIYVDPYMKYNDNRIVLGRKNNPDQPGIIFVPYLMAQSISIISEATFAPRMLLRSRYAVAEVGWYPQKQYMTIKVKDANSLLN
jgi:hypothetical protein